MRGDLLSSGFVTCAEISHLGVHVFRIFDVILRQVTGIVLFCGV